MVVVVLCCCACICICFAAVANTALGAARLTSQNCETVISLFFGEKPTKVTPAVLRQSVVEKSIGSFCIHSHHSRLTSNEGTCQPTFFTVDPTVLFAAGFSQVHSQSSYDIVTQGSS